MDIFISTSHAKMTPYPLYCLEISCSRIKSQIKLEEIISSKSTIVFGNSDINFKLKREKTKQVGKRKEKCELLIHRIMPIIGF